MSGYRIFSPAKADIGEILRYIKADRPQSARKLREKFKKEFERLGRQPGIGHLRRDLIAYPEVRFWRVDNYLVVYRNHLAKGVGILRVLHRSRDIAGLLNDEMPEDD